ncbi:MAG TPA: hypothetical protein V6C78_09055 [Crinalium sp.]
MSILAGFFYLTSHLAYQQFSFETNCGFIAPDGRSKPAVSGSTSLPTASLHCR